MITDAKEIVELIDYILRNEHFRNYIKELAKQTVVEMDGEGFFDHDHAEEEKVQK